MSTNTEALAALSYAEAAKLLANELDYKYQRGIDPHDGEWREAVTLLHRLSAVEAERDALRADAERYRWLRNEAWGGNNKRGPHLVEFKPGYVPSRFTELAEEAADAAIDAAMKDHP